jgi:phosphoribosylanthranilate isomerase
MPVSWILDPPSAGAGGVRVKICGLTRAEDAAAAVEAGADALGFNFWPGSKRALDFAEAAGWIAEVPARAVRIAVVVNPAEKLLRTLADSGLFDAVQFHGDESPAFCADCGLPWLRAFRGRGGAGQGGTPEEYATPWWLFDAAAPGGIYGGTGHRADWESVAGIVRQHPSRGLFLAGGLTPENVGPAIRSVRPFGVDVAGGVESAPGVKDPTRMRAFVQAARAVGASTEKED